MTISVGGLLEVPYLAVEVYAGSGGLGREIGWTQVSELPDPGAWLEPGALVMTTGLGIPEEGEAQGGYVGRLAAAGMSGLLVGERPWEGVNAPAFTPALAEAANEHSFPIVTVPYERPFSDVAQVVSQATYQQEHSRLVQALQIYDSVRLMGGGVSGPRLIEQLAKVAGCELHVLDPADGRPLFADSSPLSTESLATVISAFSRDSAASSALRRLSTGPRTTVALRLPTPRAAVLVARAYTSGEPDLFVLRHVAAVVAWEVEKDQAERERRRRLGAELLADLLDNRIEGDTAMKLLADWGLHEKPLALAATPLTDEDEHAGLHLRLEERGIKHIMARREDSTFTLLPSSGREIEIMAEEVGSAIGVSDPLGRLARTSDAAREALWALRGARATGKKVVRYGENTTSHFLPRTLSESRAAIRRTLGPISDYDKENGTELLGSLWSYLSNNRSLVGTAAELHVHKQTVVYRMNRVEALTGRRLDSMEELANFWLALKAMHALGERGE